MDLIHEFRNFLLLTPRPVIRPQPTIWDRLEEIEGLPAGSTEDAVRRMRERLRAMTQDAT